LVVSARLWRRWRFRQFAWLLAAAAFGWDTLATRILEMTSEGEWERAALPAVTLVIAGLIPVLMLVQRSATQQH
jgi:ABC-type Fe3+ transport system permease subunit